MFLFYKNEILLLLSAQLRKGPGKSWNFVKSHGKSWTLNQFFWWEPWYMCKMEFDVFVLAKPL